MCSNTFVWLISVALFISSSTKRCKNNFFHSLLWFMSAFEFLFFSSRRKIEFYTFIITFRSPNPDKFNFEQIYYSLCRVDVGWITLLSSSSMGDSFDFVNPHWNSIESFRKINHINEFYIIFCTDVDIEQQQHRRLWAFIFSLYIFFFLFHFNFLLLHNCLFELLFDHLIFNSLVSALSEIDYKLHYLLYVQNSCEFRISSSLN